MNSFEFESIFNKINNNISIATFMDSNLVNLPVRLANINYQRFISNIPVKFKYVQKYINYITIFDLM